MSNPYTAAPGFEVPDMWQGAGEVSPDSVVPLVALRHSERAAKRWEARELIAEYADRMSEYFEPAGVDDGASLAEILNESIDVKGFELADKVDRDFLREAVDVLLAAVNKAREFAESEMERLNPDDVWQPKDPAWAKVSALHESLSMAIEKAEDLL
jgi:hypothetical protein